MASLQIPVGRDHHITLVHFETVNDSKREKIFEVMAPVVAKVRSAPVGVFSRRAMMGYRKDKPAMLVDSLGVNMIGEKIRADLAAAGVAFSKQFEYVPHVTNPLEAWQPNVVVPMADYAVLMIHGKMEGLFELRA